MLFSHHGRVAVARSARSHAKPAMIDPDCGISVMPVSFGVVTLCAWMAVVGLAVLVRGRPFGTFAGIIVGLHSLIAGGIGPHVSADLAAVCGTAHHGVSELLLLLRPALRPWPVRVLINWPGSFLGGTLLAMPWAVVRALGFTPRAAILYGLGVIGFCNTRHIS